VPRQLFFHGWVQGRFGGVWLSIRELRGCIVVNSSSSDLPTPEGVHEHNVVKMMVDAKKLIQSNNDQMKVGNMSGSVSIKNHGQMLTQTPRSTRAFPSGLEERGHVSKLPLILDLSECPIQTDTELRIVWEDTTPWFFGVDIAKILGYGDCRKAVDRYVDDEDRSTFEKIIKRGPISSNFVMTNMQPHTVLINKKAFETMIFNQRKQNTELVKFLVEKYQLNVTLRTQKSLLKERKFIASILSVFGSEKHQVQYRVSRYRIDLYFPDLKIAIECDEFGHKSRDQEYEEMRQKYIEDELGCVFFRFNPDVKDFDIFKVIGDLYLLIKPRLNLVQSQIETKPHVEPEKKKIVEKDVVAVNQTDDEKDVVQLDQAEKPPDPQPGTRETDLPSDSEPRDEPDAFEIKVTAYFNNLPSNVTIVTKKTVFDQIEVKKGRNVLYHRLVQLGRRLRPDVTIVPKSTT
jgi:very-short-patch-repair endonuclease